MRNLARKDEYCVSLEPKDQLSLGVLSVDSSRLPTAADLCSVSKPARKHPWKKGRLRLRRSLQSCRQLSNENRLLPRTAMRRWQRNVGLLPNLGHRLFW